MPRRIRVGFSCRHAGLTRLMLDLWTPLFDVRVQEHYPPITTRMGIELLQGDEDIYFSTIHHPDLLNQVEYAAVSGRGEAWNYKHPDAPKPLYDGSRPVVAYLTDPLMPEVHAKLNGEWTNLPWLYRVGCEDCYSPEQFSHVHEWIPFALNPIRYHMYHGQQPTALIVQRHPLDRLRSIAPYYLNQPAPSSLTELMGDIPYVHPSEPNFHKFVLNYSEKRVLFYWSDSPYTITLFEAMTAGMPVVALRTPWAGNVDPLAKYLPADAIYTDIEAAKDRIRQYLREDAPARIEYPLFSFEEIQQKWLDLFTRLAG